MDSNDLIPLETAVTDFLLGTKKSTEDYVVYLKNAIDVVRSYHVYNSKKVRSEKVSVSTLGIVEFPTDMIGFKNICVAKNGEWWSMTLRPDMVNTTTTTGGVEGHDSTFGEGVALRDGITTTYGAKGAVNEYYYMIDWNARRIFLDGIISDTVLLKYTSSGINISGTTYIPSILIPVLESYLLWRETFWIRELIRERESRKQDYVNAKMELRNYQNSLTSSQWQDLFWGLFTQTPKR